MFVYGVCIGDSGKYERVCRPALEQSAPRATVVERREQTSILRAYNSIIEAARPLDPEGLVLMHDDVEIRDPAIEDKLRSAFADDRVAIVGVIGGRGVRSLQWSQADHRFGRVEDAFYGVNAHGATPADVDIVDGLFLALSPWALQHLEFDELTFQGFHGYDADICMQARSHGRQVRVVDISLFHHTKGGFGDEGDHRRADHAFRRKWSISSEDFNSLGARIKRRIRVAMQATPEAARPRSTLDREGPRG